VTYSFEYAEVGPVEIIKGVQVIFKFTHGGNREVMVP